MRFMQLITLVAVGFGFLANSTEAAAQAPAPGLDESVTEKSLRAALVSEAVLIVHGSGGDEATADALRAHAEALKTQLEAKMDGRGWPITVRADGEVSLAELGGTALFLVGTTTTNVVMALVESSYPVGIDDRGVTVGGERFDGDDVSATFAMVNPFNPRHYAVIYTGVTDFAVTNAPDFTFDEIGYVVVDGAGVRARGQFDTTIPDYWTILPGASVKQVSERLVSDAQAMELSFQPEQPMPGLDDKWVFMLGYGPHSGTAELPGFAMPYLTQLHRQRGVRLVALEAPLWMSDFLDTYVVDGKAPPIPVELPEETASFIEELRSYNRGLAADQRIHLATFDLNHDVFSGSGANSLLPLKTAIGQLRDREARKTLSQVTAGVTEVFEGGNPAAMLQAVNRLNEAVAVAALQKQIPAEAYPALRAYLDTEKTSIFFHQPENRDRRDTPALEEARARILRQNLTAVIQRGLSDLQAPVMVFLDAAHCNKGAPGLAYGRIPMGQYFDKYYEPTWEKVHVTVAWAFSGGYRDVERRSAEVISSDHTPDEFESLVSEFRKPNSLVMVGFSDPFWAKNRLTIRHTWTWPAQLYDGMAFFFDVNPASGSRITIGQ